MIDNYDIWEAHERREERRRERLPHCIRCGEAIIGEDAYNMPDGIWCEDCFNDWVKEIKVSLI